MRRTIIAGLLLAQLNSNVCAQRVLYSPFVGNEPETKFAVIGKAGNHYWIEKSRQKPATRRQAARVQDLQFEVYDGEMNQQNAIPFGLPGGLLKEYLVPGPDFFDQLMLLPGEDRTIVLLNRFTPAGDVGLSDDTLCYFPPNMKGGDFLLARSQDKSKILLLAFETVEESPPKLRSILFDKDWNVLYQTIYTDSRISKPFVQYELVEYPLEDFVNCPVKLANNGDWIMTTSSGVNHNYALFHFGATGEGFVFNEIKLPPAIIPEEVVLSIDNKKEEAFAGILSRIRTPAIKSVRIAHYSLTQRKIDFDTSYRFSTAAINKVHNENIYEEYFMIVPGKGCILLKEYGTPISLDHPDEPLNMQEDAPGINIANSAASYINKNEYTRYKTSLGTRSAFDRGDLSMYYLPATRNDSMWSGIINKEQATNITSSYLSYVFLPKDEKLFFLYNSLFRNDDQKSSSTVLDHSGNSLDEGVMYWKMNNELIFQGARQITENELAIPYRRNGRTGFAIIRL